LAATFGCYFFSRLFLMTRTSIGRAWKGKPDGQKEQYADEFHATKVQLLPE
jgi:hypothetical protein